MKLEYNKYRLSNERMQNSLYLTTFMVGVTMDFFTKELGITRQYMSALCNHHRQMTTVMRLAIEAIIMKHFPEYYFGFLCNEKYSDNVMMFANDYIKERRRYKDSRKEKFNMVLEILNEGKE